MNFDIDAWEERSAIMEFDGGLHRFEAETLAAKAQGVSRHEAIRIRDTAQARDQRAQPERDAADDLPRVQPAPEEETRSVSQRDVQTGRDRLALLALRTGRR